MRRVRHPKFGGGQLLPKGW